ncbi:MAG: DUF6103 family protein [Oscillospiraceae bacterium]
MKKTTFNVSFDEDKASALVLYLSQKGTTVETELEKSLDTLYAKTVPAGVREFIDMRSGAPFLPCRSRESQAHENRAYQ